MLENILNSKLKKKLLSIFFAFPARSFSATELKEIIEFPLRQVSKSLSEFARLDVVHVASRKRHRVYRINPRFPLYAELVDLVSDKEFDQREDRVVRILSKVPNLKVAILSGIFTFQIHSAVDILVVGDSVNRLRLNGVIDSLEKLVGQEVNYTLLSRKEYEYRRILNDRFVRDILDNPHIVLIDNLKKRGK